MKTLTGSLLLAAAVLTMNAMPASAADQVITRSTVVKFGDLNLGSEAGAQALYQRITRAANKMCEEATDRFPTVEYRNCVTRAIADAVAKVDRPALYVEHQSKTPHPAG